MGKLQEKIGNYWKKNGAEFDDFYGRLSKFSPRKIIFKFLEKRTKTLQEFLGPLAGRSILDLGCGSGIQMAELAPLCQKIIGVDVSEPMLDAARKFLRGQSANNWELILSDAQRLPFTDRNFDTIFSLGLLDYVSDPKAVLRECLRVLKPEGDIIFTIPKKPSPFSFFRTRIGVVLRRRIFGLPPILNAVSQKELFDIGKSCGLFLIKVESIWQTMWIVKAKSI